MEHVQRGASKTFRGYPCSSTRPYSVSTLYHAAARCVIVLFLLSISLTQVRRARPSPLRPPDTTRALISSPPSPHAPPKPPPPLPPSPSTPILPVSCTNTACTHIELASVGNDALKDCNNCYETTRPPFVCLRVFGGRHGWCSR